MIFKELILVPRTKEGCERERLKKQIRECFGISEDSNAVANALVDELYWQIIKLRECRNRLDDSSLAVEFRQGEQEMMIQNPLLKTYNDLIKNQSTTIKSLTAIIGKKSGSDNDLKEMMEFLNKGRK